MTEPRYITRWRRVCLAMGVAGAGFVAFAVGAAIDDTPTVLAGCAAVLAAQFYIGAATEEARAEVRRWSEW